MNPYDTEELDQRLAKAQAEMEEARKHVKPLVLCDYTSTCYEPAVNKIEMSYGWIIVCDEHLPETEEMRDAKVR